jgi:SRSO17 transposase
MTSDSERFDRYIDAISVELGHADRVAPFRAYCTGLMLPGERKSVEPLAAQIAPTNVRRAHQSLHHFVSTSTWDDQAVLMRVGKLTIPVLQEREQFRAWIVDDTGIPKKGKHSVGVAHQYCGQLGKQANCQVAVSLSIATTFASLPIAYRLCLPQVWIDDAEKRKTTGISDEIVFATKQQISLEQIRKALAADIPPGVVVADAAYGNDTAFREGITALNLQYAISIQAKTSVWRPGEAPLAPPKRRGARGFAPFRLQRTADQHPISALDLARELPPSAFKEVTWREGTKKALRSRFAAIRVRPAHRDKLRSTPREYEWLLVEWPLDESLPTKYWLSTLDASTGLQDLVDTAKLRWRIERDYQELKQELGLGQYEGRGWRGFHHHATLCIAAYGFLLIDQGGFSPSARRGLQLQKPPVPDGFQPRGASNSRAAARPTLHHDDENTNRERAR